MQNEDGAVVLLSANNLRQRSSIAKKLLTPSKDGLLGGPTKKVPGFIVKLALTFPCELFLFGDLVCKQYAYVQKCISCLSSHFP